VPERSPAAIRAELPAEFRRQFEADYRAALDDAKRTFRLDGVDRVVEGWWRTVWARRAPGHEQAVAYARRWLAGEPVQPAPEPVDVDALLAEQQP